MGHGRIRQMQRYLHLLHVGAQFKANRPRQQNRAFFVLLRTGSNSGYASLAY
ncbi:hypothetical protein Y017_06150 [Alcanivorax sp. 97CO-5]|nr:hypothetical protein Y017_06150 [Alcanivorax sp. 97CO-5]